MGDHLRFIIIPRKGTEAPLHVTFYLSENEIRRQTCVY